MKIGSDNWIQLVVFPIHPTNMNLNIVENINNSARKPSSCTGYIPIQWLYR